MKTNNIIFRGIPISQGIYLGKSFVFNRYKLMPRSKNGIVDIDRELQQLQKAFDDAKVEIEEMKKHIGDILGKKYSDILNAQILFLEDNELHKLIKLNIEEKRMNAEMAFKSVLRNYINSIETQTSNEYLKDRALDFKDIGMRVIDKLSGILTSNIKESRNKIVISDDLSLTELLKLSREKITGIILENGGKTSHCSIVAKALEIPMTIQVKGILSVLKSDKNIIIDGRNGVVIVNPNENTRRQFEKKKMEYIDELNDLKGIRDLEATTMDGVKINLAANIEMPLEVDIALHNGARGIGLYRTEFLYIEKGYPPTINELYMDYKQVVEKINPNSVIIRTVDLGADKLFHDIYLGKEHNPFLGWRGIRICLAKEIIFREQIKAILKSSLIGDVKIMLPMVSTVEEVERAREIIDDVKKEIDYPEDKHIDIGIMIEVPSAALVSDKLAPIVDFFSIGSNDLTQYTLAVDRNNYRVSYLYDSLHPSVLSLIKMTIDNAHKNSIWVGVCGEMAADPFAIPVLLGLGVDELSMTPLNIPIAKKIIRTMSISEAKIIADRALKFNNGEQTREDIKKGVLEKFISLKNIYFPRSVNDDII
jgi:phosphotransferase system enzyme I (PtsI)